MAPGKAWIDRIKQSSFARDVLHLMSGTVVAQAIPILLTPLLSRCFSPADFGLYALFTGISSILVVIATLRLEYAVMLPGSEEGARKIVLTVVAFACCFCLLLFFLLLGAGGRLIALFKLQSLRGVLLLIPCYVFIVALVNVFRFYRNRRRQFRLIRNVTIGESAVRGTSNLLIGFTWKFPAGLVVSQLIASFFSLVVLTGREWRMLVREARHFTYKDVFSVFKRYKRHLLFLMPGGILNLYSVQVPLYFIAYFYSAEIVGQYSIGLRVVGLPMLFLSSAVVESFRQRAMDIYQQTGNLRPFFVRYVKRMCWLSFLPFLLLFLGAPLLFRIYLGEKWLTAGVFVQILTVKYFFAFIFDGLSSVVNQVTETFQFEIYWQASFLVLSVALMALGHYWKESVEYALFFYTLGCTLMYLVNFRIAYIHAVRPAARAKEEKASPSPDQTNETL